MTIDWNTEDVADIIEKHVKTKEVILTFDSYGVSGHTNHKACYQAVKELSKKFECYQLQSCSLLVKYLGWLTVIFERLLYSKTSDIYLLSPLQVINNVYGAMQQHQSQLKWFRLLYLAFSKYVIVNKVERIK